MEALLMTTLTKDELETLVIDCLKAFHKYSDSNISQAMPTPGRVMTLPDLVAYSGMAASTIYKLTSKGEMPHSKRAKRLFFERDQIDAWLLERPAHTKADTEKEVNQFLATAGSRRRVA